MIALTHMRWPNDTQLANSDNNIDLYLGEHDHDYIVKKVGRLQFQCIKSELYILNIYCCMLGFIIVGENYLSI